MVQSEELLYILNKNENYGMRFQCGYREKRFLVMEN